MMIKKLLRKLGEDTTSSMLLGGAGALLVLLLVAVFWHFQFGGNIPGLEIKNPESAQYWGQIGDFFGGILNPFLSFLALIAVSLSLRSQTTELKSAREEATKSLNAQNVQTKVYERQSFESVFFGLLELHSKNMDSMRRKTNGAAGLTFFSLEADYYDVRSRFLSAESLDETSAVSLVAKEFMVANGERMAHYFGTLLELLDYVDSYGRVELKRRPFIIELTGPSPETQIRQRYARIVRAVLSSAELHLLFLYCVTPDGEALKSMVEKYSLLKNYDVKNSISLEVKHFYVKPKAFGATTILLDLNKA
jgi:hypothetical protein